MQRVFFSFLFFTSLFLFAENTSLERPKLYCLYTPDFQNLYANYFLPSIQDDFQLVVKEYPQECLSGNFREKGWNKTMLRKLEMTREAILENWEGPPFFYSDIDIVFIKPILETSIKLLGKHDFVIQQGWPEASLCAGFFIMKGNDKTLKLLDQAIDLLQREVCVDDQVALQTALKKKSSKDISWALLPSEQFPNGRRVFKNRGKGLSSLYTIDSEIELDPSILLFHANCCVGLENKYHFLNKVLELNRNFN